MTSYERNYNRRMLRIKLLQDIELLERVRHAKDFVASGLTKKDYIDAELMDIELREGEAE